MSFFGVEEKGYLQFKASMGKQVAFCKKGDMAPWRRPRGSVPRVGPAGPSRVKNRWRVSARLGTPGISREPCRRFFFWGGAGTTHLRSLCLWLFHFFSGLFFWGDPSKERERERERERHFFRRGLWGESSRRPRSPRGRRSLRRPTASFWDDG